MRSHVIVDLKNAAFKPEFAGKLNFCLSAVGDLLRTEHGNHGRGTLLRKTRDNVVAEHALRAIGKPMGASESRLAEMLPEGFAELPPSPEDIEKRMREGGSAAAVAQFASEEKASWTSLN